jgi:hypothetical protein
MKLIKFKTELTHSQLVTEFEKIPMTDLEFIINLTIMLKQEHFILDLH